MSNSPFVTTTTSGAEIVPIVEKLYRTLDGESIHNATVALIWTTFTLMYPEITNDNLASGIKDVSQYIAMQLDQFEHGENKSKSLLN